MWVVESGGRVVVGNAVEGLGWFQAINKFDNRCGAPRPPMTDVGNETAFDSTSASISEKVNIS